ncbi:MAG: hypothetical protein AAGJ18_06115 [Bacteroidota bacterium]
MIILFSLLLWGGYINAEALINTGMAVIILLWIPLMIGLFTLILYLLSRLVTKRRNWWITIFGMGLNLIYVISIFLS